MDEEVYAALTKKRIPHEIIKDTRTSKEYELSFIINFYNEEEKIDLLLNSLKNQTDKQNVELIFIDDQSTDETLKKVLRNIENMDYDYLVISNSINVGLRPARALGIDYASGKLLGTLDAHLVLEKNFTETIKNAFQKEEDLGAAGPMVLPYGEKWFHQGMALQKKLEYRLRKDSKEEYISGGAAIYRREPLNEMGGLREDDIPVDIYTSVEFRKRGWKVKILEDLMVKHYSPQSFFSFLNRRKNRENVKRKATLLSERSDLIRSKTFWLKLSPILVLFTLIGCGVTLYCTYNTHLLLLLTKIGGILFGVGFTLLYGLYYSLSHNFTKSLYATLFVPFHMMALSIKTLRSILSVIGKTHSDKS